MDGMIAVWGEITEGGTSSFQVVTPQTAVIGELSVGSFASDFFIAGFTQISYFDNGTLLTEALPDVNGTHGVRAFGLNDVTSVSWTVHVAAIGDFVCNLFFWPLVQGVKVGR